jgi:hypothetical protein
VDFVMIDQRLNELEREYYKIFSFVFKNLGKLLA